MQTATTLIVLNLELSGSSSQVAMVKSLTALGQQMLSCCCRVKPQAAMQWRLLRPLRPQRRRGWSLSLLGLRLLQETRPSKRTTASSVGQVHRCLSGWTRHAYTQITMVWMHHHVVASPLPAALFGVFAIEGCHKHALPARAVLGQSAETARLRRRSWSKDDQDTQPRARQQISLPKFAPMQRGCG